MRCPNCGGEIKHNQCVECGYTPNNVNDINLSNDKKLTGPLPLNHTINNRYTVKELIGTGGMGRAYKATDETLKRVCVIKEFDSELGNLRGNALEGARKGFESEAKILTELRHQNMPAVFDFFREYGREYFATELVEGKNLYDLSSNLKKPLDESQIIEIGINICDVLIYVHGRKPSIIHRDIKPDNIILDRSGRYYLIDFGAARNYVEGRNDTIAFGTQGYAAPEAENKMSETKSDIYSLGMTLFVLATGKNPEDYVTGSFPSVNVINKAMSVELSDIIAKAISLNPARRYSAEEMKKALLSVKGEECNCISCGRSVKRTLLKCPFCGGLINEVPSYPWESIRGDRTNKAYRSYKINFKGNIKWERSNFGSLNFSPLVSEDIIIVPINQGSEVMGVDINSGKPVWHTRNLNEKVSKNGFIMGSYAYFPLVGGIIKLDVNTGAIVSTFVLPEECITVALSGSAGYIVAMCGNKLLLVDANNGNVKWKYENTNSISTYASWIEDEIIFGDDSGIVTSLSCDGKRKWEVSTKGGKIAGAIAYDNGLFFVCTVGGKIICIEKGGIIGWSKAEMKTFTYSPCICEDLLVTGSFESGVTAYSKLSGQLLWSQSSIKCAVSAPLCCGDSIFVFDYKSRNALDLNLKGEIIRSFSASEKILFPSAIYKDNLVTSTTDGRLIVLN